MPAVLHQLRRQLGPEKEGRKEGCDNVKPYTREEFEHVADRRPGPPHLEVERLVATVREAWELARSQEKLLGDYRARLLQLTPFADRIAAEEAP